MAAKRTLSIRSHFGSSWQGCRGVGLELQTSLVLCNLRWIIRRHGLATESSRGLRRVPQSSSHTYPVCRSVCRRSTRRLRLGLLCQCASQQSILCIPTHSLSDRLRKHVLEELFRFRKQRSRRNTEACRHLLWTMTGRIDPLRTHARGAWSASSPRSQTTSESINFTTLVCLTSPIVAELVVAPLI